jgi:hypothetical protein
MVTKNRITYADARQNGPSLHDALTAPWEGSLLNKGSKGNTSHHPCAKQSIVLTDNHM